MAHQIECMLLRQTCEWQIGPLRPHGPERRAFLFLNGKRRTTMVVITKLTCSVGCVKSCRMVWWSSSLSSCGHGGCIIVVAAVIAVVGVSHHCGHCSHVV